MMKLLSCTPITCYVRPSSSRLSVRTQMHCYNHIKWVSPAVSSIGSSDTVRIFSSNNNKRNTYKFDKKSFKVPRNLGGAGLGILIAGATKWKSILAALKVTKLSTLASMGLTIGAYSTIYGLPYGCGIVGLIFVHESGHALAMKYKKIPYSPMVFVPFMGAVIGMKENAKNAYDEAFIALAGPVAGTAGALVTCAGGHMMNSQLLIALADFGFMVNLFNMIPIGSLDGGRIGNALSPHFGLIGLGVSGTMIMSGSVSNPIFYLITAAGGWQTASRYYDIYKGGSGIAGGNASDLPRNYYRITNDQRYKIAGGYFGLLGVLFGCMATNEKYKKSPEQVRFEQMYGSTGQGMNNIYRDH